MKGSDSANRGGAATPHDFWRLHGLAPQIASDFQGFPLDSRSFASRKSRSVSARRKARSTRRKEVNQVMRLFDAFKREEGQTMAEYGVVLAVITLAVITAITLLSTNVRSAITSVANILPGG